MSVPDYVLVGVARAGTTSLHRYLAQHPGVAVSDIKEMNFLAYPGPEIARTEYPWVRFPVTDLEDYERLFDRRPGQIAVDFSASCFHIPVAIPRIQRFVPDASLIVVLRDPVARTYSAYLNRVRKGYERRPPERALLAGEHAVENSRYASRLRAFREAFGAERVKVFLFEDLHDPAGSGLRSVFEQLGVDPDVPIDTSVTYNRASVPRRAGVTRLVPSYRARTVIQKRLPTSVRRAAKRAWTHTQADAPPLDIAIEARLRREFECDVQAVSTLIDRDLDSWLPR